MHGRKERQAAVRNELLSAEDCVCALEAKSSQPVEGLSVCDKAALCLAVEN